MTKNPFSPSPEEYQAYLRQEIEFEQLEAGRRNGYPRKIAELTDFYQLQPGEGELATDEQVEYTTVYGPSEIKRVRRITGYFAEMGNFNNAKRAELGDRVAHDKTMTNASGRVEHVGIEDAILNRLTMERELAVEGYAVNLDGRSLDGRTADHNGGINEMIQ